MPIGWRNTWYWITGIITWGFSGASPVKADSVRVVQLEPHTIRTFEEQSATKQQLRLISQTSLNRELPTTAPMAEVTAVSQLAVEPNDDDLQTLRSLVLRYGVLLGFPDQSFLGNRSLSRFEFAAALDQILNRVNTLIRERVNIEIDQQDLMALQRLQREYDTILQELGTQLNTLGDRTTQIALNQFSTTTKLNGEAIVAITQGTDADPTVVFRQQLNFLTSFSANDRLLTQLEVGAGEDAIALAHNNGQNLLGTDGLLADGGGLDYIDAERNLRLRRVYYTFVGGSDLSMTVGAKMSPSDFIDRNRFANNSAVDFSSSFLTNNPLIIQNQIDREGGAGAAIAWNINGGDFTVRSLYIAADSNQPNSTILTSGGLFNDRYQGSLELEYSPSANLAVRLQYTNAAIHNTNIQAAGVNAEYALNRNAAIFGRVGVGSYQGFNTAINEQVNFSPSTWTIGLTVRNLAIPGTLAGIAFGQPFVEDNLGNATQTNFEAFYNLTLSENISVTPALQLVKYANNQRSNGTIWQGTLRTVFSF